MHLEFICVMLLDFLVIALSGLRKYHDVEEIAMISLCCHCKTSTTGCGCWYEAA